MLEQIVYLCKKNLKMNRDITKFASTALLLLLLIGGVGCTSQKNEPMKIAEVIAESTTSMEATSAILLVNTGTPLSLTRGEVKRFIGDMLSDSKVVGLPDWLRPLLARQVVAPLRASSSLERYRQIWGEGDDSPLMRHSQVLAAAVESLVGQPVHLAMRYGMPNPEHAMRSAAARLESPIEELILFPLFPQYAESSYATAVEATCEGLNEAGYKGAIRVVKPYFNHPAYITALANQLRPSLEVGFDLLLFSFHSLPMSHIEAGRERGEAFDYHHQCLETSRLVAKELGLTTEQYRVAWASSVGWSWQRPYLEDEVTRLAREGVGRLVVTAPGFIVDNLESLYDLGVEAKSLFREQGGEEFCFVPCLNDAFAAALVAIASEAR